MASSVLLPLTLSQWSHLARPCIIQSRKVRKDQQVIKTVFADEVIMLKRVEVVQRMNRQTRANPIFARTLGSKMPGRAVFTSPTVACLKRAYSCNLSSFEVLSGSAFASSAATSKSSCSALTGRIDKRI